MSSPILGAMARTSSMSSLTPQPAGWRSVASAVASFARRVVSGLAATGSMGGAAWAAGQLVEHLRAPAKPKSDAQVKLDAFIKHPKFNQFQAFALTEHSGENSDFLAAAHGFEKLGDAAARTTFASLYEKFFADDAVQQVNLPSAVFTELQGLYEGLSKASAQELQTALDKATEQILKLVTNDSWIRFEKSLKP